MLAMSSVGLHFARGVDICYYLLAFAGIAGICSYLLVFACICWRLLLYLWNFAGIRRAWLGFAWVRLASLGVAWARSGSLGRNVRNRFESSPFGGIGWAMGRRALPYLGPRRCRGNALGDLLLARGRRSNKVGCVWVSQALLRHGLGSICWRGGAEAREVGSICLQGGAEGFNLRVFGERLGRS